MATRIRTLNFLPEIFKTPTNAQFLAATLDQIVDQPSTKKIEGYIGSKFGYGINAKNYYVTEPTKTRTDYQLDPGIVLTDANKNTPKDFISYPGIIDSLKVNGGVTNNNNRLFESQFYSWDSFTDLDKVINFNQYYWLPLGPESVTVSSETVFSAIDYIVQDIINGYSIYPVGSSAGSTNPTLTLLRGGTYTFAVNQDSEFWIQGVPGVTGFSPTQPNLQTREVYGVSNNGISQGVVTFTVPFKNAQDEYNFPGNNLVSVVSTLPFAEVNGKRLSELGSIDGITALNGLTVMFYNTGVSNEIGYVSNFFDYTNYDQNNNITAPQTVTATATSSVDNSVTITDTSVLTVGNTITFTGVPFGNLAVYSEFSGGTIYYVRSIINGTKFTVSSTLGGPAVVLTTASGTLTGNINQGLLEQGFYTTVNENFYTITFLDNSSDPVISLSPAGAIPTNQKITASFGTNYSNRNFYKNEFGTIVLIPYLSAQLDTLYYQDGTSANKVGIIKLIESNATNTLDVETEILGKKNFSSTNGIVFTNGLKVSFQGDVVPTSYLSGEYYVEGVGSHIELIPVDTLVVPEAFTESVLIPYDTTPYDFGNFDGDSFIPVSPDYITIARNSVNKNAWSRSNRWFHIDVINATAQYNNDPESVAIYATAAAKAKRPIIEFYPNLKLFNQGSSGKNPVDFVDFRTSDAFTYVAGQESYYPDVAVYTDYTSVIASTNYTQNRTITNTDGPSDTVTINSTTGFRVNDIIILDPPFSIGGLTYNTNYYVAEVVDGTTIKVSLSKNGAVINLTTAASVCTAKWYPQSTTIQVTTADIGNNEFVGVGTFTVGQYVADSTNLLPPNTIIESVTGTSTKTLVVSWGEDQSAYFNGTSVASIIAVPEGVNSYAVFDGARIIFAADTDENVRNKIYVVRFSSITGSSVPVITLTEADDGLVLPDQQTVAYRGYNYLGLEFWYDGIEWIKGQEKVTVNQAPLFDIFDNNGISFSDSTVYTGTDFSGSTLFQYGIGSGLDDNVLGFPLKYSSINNIGDISFDVTFNSDIFNYVSGSTPITEQVNKGYVYNYNYFGTLERLLGWQTAVSPSVQYQLFSFNYTLGSDPVFTVDVGLIPDTQTEWPIIQVFNNNTLLETSAYSVTSLDTSTVVTLDSAPVEDTVIQIAVLSSQVSENAYFTIPINLNNNPLNQDITVANLGDIRGQYQSIFYNNPNLTGQIFGSNNYRDSGNLVPWGNRIIQNSASLVLPGAFLRDPNTNIFNALSFNSKEYIKFKTLLVDTINNTDYSQQFDPSFILDDALDQMTASKTDNQSFFWSDMIPSKAAFVTNVYSFANSLDISRYPLTKIYDFSSANYSGILVYLTRTINNITTTQQLIINQDYTVSVDSPSLTVTYDLLPNDIITVKEYNQTYGSYVPNTPTKLGMYPASIPEIVLDSDYSTPTYFIKGHDGSYTKLYGDYDPQTGILVDFRDQALFEFEKRVYNNLKLSNVIPIKEYEVTPGFFRTTDYSYDEWLQIYTTNFLAWVGENRLNYKRQVYNKFDQYTYNYTDSGNKLNGQPIEQGYWRGIYQYFYDTTTPNLTPWEMIGYTNKPAWWEDRYGPAPYTSDNLVLWEDLENGIDYNNGNPVVIEQAIRPGLLEVLPVNSAGNLLSPFASVVGNYNPNLFQRDWKVGDDSPVELSYRRSSSYPFDLMRILALMKPAKFFNLAADIDNYKYNYEFNQYLVNDRSHLVISDIQIYGNGIAKTSYINWIVDYQKQIGIDATTKVTELLQNLDVRLVYRMAGFSDKTFLKFYVEKGTPNSRNASLLIPDESYSLLLYENQPFTKLIYSGIIIQIVPEGYAVYGNSQTQAYFTTLAPRINVDSEIINVESTSVTVYTKPSETEVIVPYGTIFYTIQEVSQFLINYGFYLEANGMVFEEVENGLEVNWKQMVAEFLYWAQTGWEQGSIVTVNPAAKSLTINKDGYVVQPLTFQQSNFILNENLYPIQTKDLSIVRDQTLFNVVPQNTGDTLAYGQFNINNIEHGIVFDNITLFDDVIYNLITGLRQLRITCRGTKTAEWNGTVTTSGFILNQDNITEWSKEFKYTKGSIVKYKNKYWTALKVVQPNNIFNELDWKLTEYGEIQKGLLSNSSTRSYESTLYYDVDRANLEKDADLLSFSLIGYRPRDYLALADLTDITQVNVYKNMIKNKGTLNAVSAFRGANLPQGGIDYEVYENWAIKSGEFGGVLNSNFVDFKLNQNSLVGNPSIVSLTDGSNTEGSQQEVPLSSLYNYDRPITDPNILATVPSEEPSTLFPDAGYVNLNDVKMSSFYLSQIAAAVDKNGLIVPLDRFYVGDYVWIANYLGTWNVYSPVSMGQVIGALNNLNGTVTITFKEQHNLTQYDPLAILNFDTAVNGYYIAALIVDPYRIIINLQMDPSIITLTGQGVGFKFQQQRVATPADIINLPLLNTEFEKNKVWVDTNNNGSWAVFRKDLNYTYQKQFTRPTGQAFGSAVAYSTNLGYLIGDEAEGAVYRYTYNELLQDWQLIQTITHGTSFGTTIEYADDIFVISEPTGSKEVHIYRLDQTISSDDLVVYQTPISAPANSVNWGQAVAISGDKNWIFISDFDNTVSPNLVHVYRKSQLTDEYEFATTVTVSGLVAGDNFGYAIATDYTGENIVISAPNVSYSVTIDDYGYAYAFNRIVQKIEVQNNSQPDIPQSFELAYTPTTVSKVLASTTAPSTLTLTTSAASLNVDDPIVFLGAGLQNTLISPNQVYYIASKSGNDITIKTSRASLSAFTVTTQGSVNATVSVQNTPIYLSVNNTLIDDNQYAIINNTLYYYGSLTAGDIITVSGQLFVNTQRFSTDTTPLIGVEFGHSLDIATKGNEIIIGAPFQLNTQLQEGAVYRFTNSGSNYGYIIGTDPVALTTNSNILINGYLVKLTPGNASSVASTINQTNITNVTATATPDNRLIIGLINNDLSVPNQQLTLGVMNNTVLAELGITLFTETQVIQCPHTEGPTQFGSTVKFGSNGSFVASAPTGSRFSETTFDFSDDNYFDNDTIFDNNTTQFIEEFDNAGAVYMFDYLPVYAESINNTGKYVYAQSVNARNLDFGAQPLYGHALDFNDNTVAIGTPTFRPGFDNGQVIGYNNITGKQDWSVYRSSSAVVDIDKINNAQIYSAQTNETLVNLDYIDPLQGKILGAVRQNIDFVSNNDPARYNNQGNIETSITWGPVQVGQIWLNTSTLRFVNYHQDDAVYNSQYWGTLFPGSTVQAFTWVESTQLPVDYAGPGTPFDITQFVINYNLNDAGNLIPTYYYWVRNTNTVYTLAGKSLADSVIESYIANPEDSGISYFVPLLPNAFGLYNIQEYLNANDSVFHIGFATGTNQDVAHNQFSLIRANYADDFLPGIPTNLSNQSVNSDYNFSVNPQGLYDRLLDSLSGVDETGQVVPNPYLPKAVQTGILARPRQSFFLNRFMALKNYLLYANEILSQFPIAEIRENITFLNEKNPTIYDPNDPTVVLFEEGEKYDVSDGRYWEFTNWWADGYSDSTKSALQVPLYSDLSTLSVPNGTIVTVKQNSRGFSETYIKDVTGWTRIGLQNGTIKFNSALWDYASARLGFGDNFYDTTPYDEYPSEETRFIIRALNEQIYTNELLIYRNRSLILLFEYIQSETIENQNYLPWLNKTSFVDVAHKIRELRPIEVFQSDNQDFLSGYLNEVKPYHVVIKEFLFEYTGSDTFEGDVTDFDLPAQYSSTSREFITPELVYINPNTDNQFTPDNSIWSNPNYTQWKQNYGVKIGQAVQQGDSTQLFGQLNYPMSRLTSYVTLNSTSLTVNNAYGFPINGVIKIGNEEIGYSSVDSATGSLLGLTRGVNETTVTAHLPGEEIFMDLPPVVVVDAGRGYVNPPKITAYVDPQITKTAEYYGSITGSTLTITTIVNGQVNVGDYLDAPGIIPQTIIVSQLTTNTYQINVAQELTTEVLFTQYSGPVIPAQLQAVMALDSVLRIDVINSGSGYAATPQIIIEPATVITFSSDDVIISTDSVRLYAPLLQTGDLVQYVVGADSTRIPGLVNNQWYYVNVLENNPTVIIAFYNNYANAINDHDRVPLHGIGTGNNQNLNLGARAYTIGTSSPVRENNITLRFDRTTYDSQIIDWQAGNFYGAYYAGQYNNSESVSSSSILLQSTQPPIESILASGQGVAFEIVNVTNDQQVTFSSLARNVVATHAGTDIIDLAPLGGGIGDTASGTTIGFYIGMPVKFIGAVGASNIVYGEVYYVTEIVSSTEFKINNTLGNQTISAAGLNCFVGEVVNTAVLTINYPGIYSCTATNKTTNTITAPLSLLGTGGTIGFYTGLPVFFTGDVFSGVIENDVYYITSVCDKQTFTVSRNPDPLIVSVQGTQSPNIVLLAEETTKLQVNNPIIFNESVGGIVAGTVYYVATVLGLDQIQISTQVNGAILSLSTASASSSATLTSQVDVLQITETLTGNMTINVNLPVSPGQINGQKFTLYPTSGIFSGPFTGETTNDLIERSISATITTVNRVALSTSSGGLTNVYVNMPFTIDTNIGGLTTGTTYYVLDTGVISIAATSTSSSTNEITCDTTESLYVDMPITFSGFGLGGIQIDQTYYVESIIDSTHFKITDFPGGVVVTLTTQNGSMTGTGEPYITVSTSAGGAEVSLSSATATATVTLTQEITTSATYDISWILGGYKVTIINAGEGYALENTINIPGTNFGGTTPANDVNLIVNSIDANGEVTSFIVNGTIPATSSDYYLKVISENELEVYSNSLMTIPVSGIGFGYNGITSTGVTACTASTDRFTVTSSSDFDLNDPVVFTGTVFGGVTLGQTYYIKSKPTSTTITVSEIPGGTTFNVSADATGSMTVAKSGDYALLPEPFYFNQSIVKFNNQVYVCVVSNNDTEFVLGKWELLDSGDRRLNALDRIMGYYQPTVNMPGLDLTQLVTGITYPNSTYLGNAFAPDDQYSLDVILPSTSFTQTDVDSTSAVYGLDKFYVTFNTADYSAIATEANSWISTKLAGSNVNLTDSLYHDGEYLVTSTNYATPIFKSTDGEIWTVKGTAGNYNINSIGVYNTGSQNYYAAGGTNAILISSDTNNWSAINPYYLPSLSYTVYGLTGVNINSGFNGLIAVGSGEQQIGGNIYPRGTFIAALNGSNWTQFNPINYKGLRAVTSGTFTSTGVGNIIAVGEDGIIYKSFDGNNWNGLNEAVVLNSYGTTNKVQIVPGTTFTVGQKVKFTGSSFGGITTGTNYWVKSVDTGDNTIVLSSASSLIPTVALTTASPVFLTTVTVADEETLNDVKFVSSIITAGNFIIGQVYIIETAGTTDFISLGAANNNPGTIFVALGTGSGTGTATFETLIAVGNNGTIVTSTDFATWTTQVSNTTNNLKGIAVDETNGRILVVGENNTALISYDGGVTWVDDAIIIQLESTYDIQGGEFTDGYGPEELVPGVVTDTLMMTVATRPGTTWEATEYQHVGFNVISLELTPSFELQTEYVFHNVAQTPAQISVYQTSGVTGLSTRLYETIDYTVNWIDSIITLNNALPFSPITDSLRVDIYETGNGNQLVKADTQTDPIRYNETTGFNEIFVNCNYSAPSFNGSGVIQPNTNPVSVQATETISLSNSIVCESVREFNLNDPIRFQGITFGGLLEDTNYYVKTISLASSSITVSTSIDLSTGVAGPTFAVTDDTGSMYAIIQVGSGVTWTDPLIYHNGTKLVHGTTGTVTKTNGATNTVTCNTTSAMVVGDKIVFSNTIFGGVIQPLTTYYIESIVDNNEFTISLTQGGPAIALTTDTGGAQLITRDYAFGLQPNGIQAKIIFSAPYVNGIDFLSYTLFGETNPQQYGYSIPELQMFVGDGVTSTFNLTNFVDLNNAANAVVEINGLRLDNTDYTINSSAETITFTTIPSLNDNIAVTTFNDTSRQYLNSQFGITGETVANIVSINNNISSPSASTQATATTSATDYITVISTTNFTVNDIVIFQGTSFGGVLTDGTVYFVRSVDSLTEFTIKDSTGTLVPVSDAVGTMNVIVGGNPAVRITTGINHNFVTNDIVRIDGTTGSTQLNNNLYYVQVINDTSFWIYQTEYDPAFNAVNSPITQITAYTGAGYVWVSDTFTLQTSTVTSTSSTGNIITVADGSSLVAGTPIVFTQIGDPLGTTIIGGLVTGTVYYIKTRASNNITISETYDGTVKTLTSGTAAPNTITISQWEQVNVDRLWVTVNGYRVPSSSLRINAGNQISILETIITTDVVIITSMMPSATPNEEVYVLTVNSVNEATVYRANSLSRTWMTQDLYNTDNIIYVNDIVHLTDNVIQNVTTPSLLNGVYDIGLTADKRIITGISVYNNTTSQLIGSSNYEIVVEELSPILRINQGNYITAGDSLTIVVLEGNLVSINGEQIRFRTVNPVITAGEIVYGQKYTIETVGSTDFTLYGASSNTVGVTFTATNNNTIIPGSGTVIALNALYNLQRGANGTGEQVIIPKYSEVYSYLSNNRMTNIQYNQTWNSYTFNTTLGDPLQISTTASAIFLNQDQT
jgi:hypothetical protein